MAMTSDNTPQGVASVLNPSGTSPSDELSPFPSLAPKWALGTLQRDMANPPMRCVSIWCLIFPYAFPSSWGEPRYRSEMS